MTWHVFAVALLVIIAAVPAPPTLAVAIGLAGIAAMLSPFALKFVPLNGPQMTGFTMLCALGLAVLASWLTGEFTWSREGIVAALLNSSAVWTAQQAAYAVLKQVAPAAVGAPAKASLPAPVPPGVGRTSLT